MLNKLNSYVNNNGKILAVGKAGYDNGIFHLTELLRAGASPYAYTLGILYNYEYGFNIDKFKKKAVYIMNRGTDGLVFMDFLRLKVPSFQPGRGLRGNVPDFEAAAGYVFHNSHLWKKPPVSIPPLGCFQELNMMWLRDWMLYRNKGMSVEKIVDICHNIGAKGIIFDFRFGRNAIPYISNYDTVPGYPEYKTQMYNKAKAESDSDKRPNGITSRIQENWMERLVDRCKKYKLALWVCTPLFGAAYEKYPEDEARSWDGKPVSTCPLKFTRRIFHHKARQIEEMLKKFPYISGICLDEPVLGKVGCRGWREKRRECFCLECKRAFKEYCGKELTPKTAYLDDKKQTKIYNEFLRKTLADNIIASCAQLLHRVNPEVKLAVADYFYRNSMLDRLADSGVDVLLGEFGNGTTQTPLKWKHKVQYFEFFRLEKNNAVTSVWGDAVKVKLFQGAVVTAWVTDGNYKYPGIVKANQGKTLYLSFDPVVLDWIKSKQEIGAALKELAGGN
ncbi:MAG: hypothetical protein WCS27_07475 [Victivallaceae bacterium]